MKRFVFGILAYNQEHLIIETLESIKYQKVQYGTDRDVMLVIVDDASADGTSKVAAKWLEKNKGYFCGVELITNEKNKGTVANYCTILNKIKDEDFKILAADDLIGNRNLFKEYDNMNSHKIKTYVRMELKDGHVYYNEKYLIKIYYHMVHSRKKGNGYHRKNFRRGSYFHTPSTIYTKQLFVNAKCEENLKGYYLYEDEPTWYSMIKNEKELEVEFKTHAIVLYRIHNKSVSNVPNTGFKNELKRLRTQYYEDSKGLEHLYFAILMSTTNLPMYLNLGLYLEKITQLWQAWVCKRDKKYIAFKAQIEKQVEEEQKFYDMLKNTLEKDYF